MEIEYIYIDESGLTVTRLKPQKTVEEYRAHSGGLWADDAFIKAYETVDDLVMPFVTCCRTNKGLYPWGKYHA